MADLAPEMSDRIPEVGHADNIDVILQAMPRGWFKFVEFDKPTGTQPAA